MHAALGMAAARAGAYSVKRSWRDAAAAPHGRAASAAAASSRSEHRICAPSRWRRGARRGRV